MNVPKEAETKIRRDSRDNTGILMNNWFNHRKTASLALPMAFLLMAGCGKSPQPEAEPPARPVKMIVVGEDVSDFTWEYPGEVKALLDVDLSFGVGGEIIAFLVEDGQQVKKGDELAKLDPVDYLAARDAAEANRRAMRSAYTRALNIFREGAGSQAEVDKTLRDITVAEQELARAQKALDDTVLKAPEDGVVARKIAEVNQNVLSKESVLTFQNTSRLEIDVAIPERDFVRMEPGLSLEERSRKGNPAILVSSLPGVSIDARLKSFATTADPVTRTYKATFAFDNPPDMNILPGMTARVVLRPSMDTMKAKLSETGHAVPVSATAADPQGKPFVWLVDPDTMKVSRVGVTLGEMTGSDIYITSGIGTGDRIVTSGVTHLQEGAKVRPLEKP